LVCAAAIGRVASNRRRQADIRPLPESRVLRSMRKDGDLYRLADDGRVYRVVDAGRRWSFVETVFDPDVIGRTYLKDGGVIYRVDPETGKRYPVQQRFEDGFEGIAPGAAGLRMLIGERRKWSEVTLQSPRAPTVPEYVDLQNRVLKGEGEFL